MASDDTAAELLFKENSKEEFLAASEILLRLANNVLTNPNEAKYRRIRIANPLLEAKLLPYVGGMECLFDMGFQEDGEYLTLPPTSSLIVLRQVRDELDSLRKTVTSQSSSVSASVSRVDNTSRGATAVARSSPPEPEEGAAAAAVPRPTLPAVQARHTQTVENLRRTEADFLQRVQSSMRHVLMYEDLALQEKARSTIPVSSLQQEAEARLHTLQQAGGREAGEVDIRDCLILELLNWFKKSFFHWVDCLPCEACGGSTHHAGTLLPTQAEQMWDGFKVENHQCDNCHSITRFPRYNHPGKLLETRRGRCGEWANCFTLCCRALRFEARYVLDWTDHVWTEVYSNAQKRWLHCDPCENVCDKPLLYEQGWGKKLTYVIAFSKDDVQDVTWRYSAKHPEVLARRHECREGWLVNLIHNLCKQKFQGMDDRRKQEMLQRLVVELVEFLTIKTEGGQALPGRTTGSAAWRLARGEMGQAAAAAQPQFIFRLLEEERHSEILHIKYSCADDRYIRASSHDWATTKWHSCASNVKSVFRKEESDWKMAYLAREEGTDTGEISWKFDLSGEDLRINKLELKAASSVFENGSVTWRICSDDDCFSVPGAQLSEFKTFELQNRQMLTITAVLSGGRGDVAWQHAQLFRQHLDDKDFPLQIILHLS